MSTLSVLMVIALLSGCGLRLETETPRAPAPDAVEVVREAMVLDVLTIRSTAAELIEEADSDESTTNLLIEIRTASDAQLDALGGIYDPGEDYISVTAQPSPSQAPGSLETLTTTLAEASNRTRSALEATAAPLDARLFASIATSHYGFAIALADIAGTALPDIDVVRAAVDPELLPPDNLELSEYRSIVATQDAIGYIREMWALHLDSDRRDRMLTRSQSDRARALDIATATGLVDTADDPREIFYDFDRDITRPRAARRTITDLRLDQVHRLSALFATIDPAQRIAVLDLMIQSYREALTATATPEPFPGLPEYQPAG